MLFDLISDFHVEHNTYNKERPTWKPGQPDFYDWPALKQSPVLVLAGDTSNHFERTKLVVQEAQQYYDHVIFLDGNHDHYCGYGNHELTVGYNSNQLLQFAKANPKLTYLNGETSVRFGDILVIGACGWYDWKANQHVSREMQHMYWKGESNDAKCIRFNPQGYPDKLARLHADLLAGHVKAAQDDDSVRKILVVTHTVPTPKALVPDNHKWGHLNGSYCNTEMQRVLDADTKKKIRTWVFGHTHYLYDFMEQGVRFVTNPRGYRGEKRDPAYLGPMQINLDAGGSAFGEIEP